MGRDTIVSWQTWALFVLVPPVAIAAIVLFPLTLLVLFWLYYRGKRQAVRTRPPASKRRQDSKS